MHVRLQDLGSATARRPSESTPEGERVGAARPSHAGQRSGDTKSPQRRISRSRSALKFWPKVSVHRVFFRPCNSFEVRLRAAVLFQSPTIRRGYVPLRRTQDREKRCCSTVPRSGEDMHRWLDRSGGSAVLPGAIRSEYTRTRSTPRAPSAHQESTQSPKGMGVGGPRSTSKF